MSATGLPCVVAFAISLGILRLLRIVLSIGLRIGVFTGTLLDNFNTALYGMLWRTTKL